MIKKIFLCLLLVLALISTAYSYECVSKLDTYIVKCEIPEKYFLQSFTCLDKDCSTKLETVNEDLQKIIFPDSKEALILKNYIDIKDIYKEPQIINQICTEKFDEEAFKEIDNKIKELQSERWNLYSGSKLVITPLEQKNLDNLKLKKQNSEEKIENCYKTSYEIHGNWIFEKKTKKDYCTLIYNDENECFKTKLLITDTISYMITNPKEVPFEYKLLLLISTITLLLIIILLYHIHKRKEMAEFFRITKHKMLIKIILLIPILYIIGYLVNDLLNKKLYMQIDFMAYIIILSISIFVTYFLACLFKYLHNNFKK